MTLNGIDISHWQTGFDVTSAGVDFVIVKATEGTSYVDPECDNFLASAKKAGVRRGVYHFAHTGSSSEADWFVTKANKHVGDAVLALDWEADAESKGPGAAKGWLDRVRDKTGVKPVIYMNKSCANSYDWSAVYKAGYGLWVAAWGASQPSISWGGAGVAIWQYADDAQIGGMAVDGDTFNGDGAAWDAFAGASQATGGAAGGSTASSASSATKVYTVSGGDTLSEIAADHGTTTAVLMDLNPAITDPDAIYVGQKITVPS